MIKSMALIAVVLGVVPFLLGLLFTRFVEEEKNNLLLHMASGYMIMFGLFEVIALPLIWQRQSLSLLIGIYGSMLIVLSVVSFIWNFKRLPEILKQAVDAVRHFTFCIWAQFAVIAGQVLIYSRYQYANADDSFYVAAATTALSTPCATPMSTTSPTRPSSPPTRSSPSWAGPPAASSTTSPSATTPTPRPRPT